jgi:hypothetical protein
MTAANKGLWQTTEGSQEPKLVLPSEALDRRVLLKLSGRELIALSRVSRDMGLSPQETIRSLIMAATLDLKPGGPKPRKGAKL